MKRTKEQLKKEIEHLTDQVRCLKIARDKYASDADAARDDMRLNKETSGYYQDRCQKVLDLVESYSNGEIDVKKMLWMVVHFDYSYNFELLKKDAGRG